MDAFQAVGPDELLVRSEPLPERVTAFVHDDLAKRLAPQSQGVEQLGGSGEVVRVEVKDVGVPSTKRRYQ